MPKRLRDRWLHFLGRVGRHPVLPIFGLILGFQSLVTGGIFLVKFNDATLYTVLAKSLVSDSHDLWLWLWGFGMIISGAFEMIGSYWAKWWLVVSGANIALACLTFSSVVYALHLPQGWIPLITPSLFTLALNAYLMALATTALKDPDMVPMRDLRHHLKEKETE